MLPTTLVTIISLILKITSSSPVYNLQPAYITGTIGSTGRNIRNLPCISRKTNQNGVCMFAIDCLKANGTHLGTCIDRFYFGSCCHVESSNDIIENTIDAALIPSREPPNRLGTTVSINTTTPMITNITTTTTATSTTTFKPTTNKPTTQKIDEDTTTIKVKPTKPHKPIIKQTTTTKKPLVTTVKRKITQKIPITTSKPIKVTNATTTPPVTSTENITKDNIFELNTLPFNNTPVTFSVSGNPATNEIEEVKPTVITLPKPTSTDKPTTADKSTSSATPTKISIIENMTKPTKITEIPPTKFTFFNFTHPINPSTLDDTKVTIITNNPTLITQTTNNPLFAQSTKEAVIFTTNKISITDTMKPSTEENTESEPSSPFTAEIVQTTPGNPSTGARPIGITLMQAATRPTEKPNLETNTFPAFVTWSQIVENTGSTTNTNNVTEDNTVTEEWVPMSTPDGWVLLPSLTTITDFATPNATTTKPITTSEKLEISSESPLFSTLIQSTENAVTTSFENITTINTSTSRPVESNNGVNMSDFTDVCGRRMFPEARIVGGEKSSFGRWPWQISLRQWRTSTYLHKCGAALLNENWAVTAAHCVDNVPPSDLLLRLGEHDLSTESEPYLHQERRVQIVASHPQFDPRTFEYDLALLRFYEPVQFQPNIIPVCVPQNDENFVGRTAYVTGWGRLYEDGPLPSILQEVSVPVINNTVCESMYRSAGYIEHIPNIFICAGWRRGGFDSCEGDSGGPMVIQRPDKRFLLAGVISWGIGCAEPNQPGVYTRISEFRDWINQILQF